MHRTSGRIIHGNREEGKGGSVCANRRRAFTRSFSYVYKMYTRLEEIRCLDIDNLRVAKERHHPVSTSASPILSDDVPLDL